MPLYEYLCSNPECDNSKERFVSQRPIVSRETCECPLCGAVANKQLSIPTDQYKDDDFSKSAYARESVEIWGDSNKGRKYYT